MSSDQPAVWLNSSQYRYASANGDIVGIHQLIACLDTDPATVFAPDTEVHHRLDTGLRLDFPQNTTVLSADEHTEVHATTDCPATDEVLNNRGADQR